MDKCNWSLGGNQTLEFKVLTKNTNWNNVAGLYIFAAIDENNYWVALYIGQTDDFSCRLPNHERWDEAVRNGATHIHAKSVKDAKNRDLWEKALIENYDPKLNTVYRQG